MSNRADATGQTFWGNVDDDVALQRYRTLVETIDDSVYQLDADGHFIAVNETILETTGYSRDDLIDEHVSVLLDEPDIERINDEIRTQLETGDDVSPFELAVQTADGTYFPCELRVNVLLEDGEFAGTIGVARDISDRKHQQETLESARASYESITTVLDEADIGVFILDDQFDVSWIDERIEEYLGLDRDEVVGRDKRAVIEDTVKERFADPDAFAENVLATYDDNSDVERFECRVTADESVGRSERWLEHRSKPIETGRYAGGRVELYYDITDRKASESALQESEKQFHSLVEAVEEYAIFRLDTDGRVISWNEGARQIKGYDREEILGEHFSTFYVDDDRAAGVPEANLEKALESGSVEDEGLRVRKDGTQFWANVTITAVRDDDGTHQGYVKVTRDMTDRREHEQQLQRERDVLDRVLDVSPVGIMVFNDDDEVTRLNDRWTEIFGRNETDLAAHTRPDEPIYDEDGQQISATTHPFTQALRTGTPEYDRILRIERSDDEHRWVVVNAVPILTDDGAVDRVVATSEDITDIKERERELETELGQILGRVSDAFYALDDEFRFTHVNERAEELLQHDEEELLGESLWDVFPESAEKDDVWESFHTALETQEPTSYELHFEPLDFRVEANLYPSETGISVYFRDVTERKERERKLERNERRYRTLVEYFPNGLVTLFDHDLEYTLAAGQGFDRIPVEPDDLEGEFFRDAWDEKTADTLEPAFEAALDGEERSIEFEYAGREWSLHAVPITDERGAVFAGMTMAQDITEQKERERYLEDAKAQLEAATEAGAVGTWEWRIPEDTFVTGASFARTFGVDPEAAREGVPLERILASVHADDRERVERKIEEAVETCGEYEEEYRVWNADGELRWVVARGYVESDEDGNAVTFPGAITDITERKRAEIELQKHKNQFETLFQVLPVGVVVADKSGRVVEANDAAREIWGGDVFDAETVEDYEKYSAVWAETGEPVDPEDWTMSEVLDGEAVTEPNVYEIEAFDGDRRIIMEHGMPVTDDRGNLRRAVVTLTDITERRAYQRRLEETVAQLEESNERLEQFAYAASHDLQEPLRMVSSYLQLIEQRYADALDEDGEEFLEYAVNGADRMRSMIEGLLEYSRVETRGDPLEPTDLGIVVDDVLDDLRLQIEDNDAEILIDELPRVEGDAGQLRQVFQNLLSNAIEYSGDEPPRVHISAERSGSMWTVSIADEGIGIDPDETDQIFEVFNRLHSREEYDGTGIGLALCERIVERHGGEIWVESEPGEGATFSFTLPAVTGQ
ncbi:PAS domain S-box protein [Natronorubrum sp. JWXQ-INN-674]|uniref:histidine kinase n=1 Tax=Natronorubrum halalkaliphilum TaxID=2691917 RepID=A0A6B0VJ31_9EURY|nr:PAS domain S-box protein [Natronorubrum halalkaliphilum]MXV61263.1 PAS domain S-box protein [Natronorubrum halalkaliphilum]